MRYFYEQLFLAGVIWAGIAQPAMAHTDLTVSQARDMINSNDSLIVVDVREESTEYCLGHIIGAVNYPWNSNVLQTRYTELPKDGYILLVCRSGTRSNNAANFLDGKGYTHIYDMTGGMNSWTYEKVGCVSQSNTGSHEPTARFDTEQIVKTSATAEIKVNGYSAASVVDWNNDGKNDLVIGEGSGSYFNARIRVYLNIGTARVPAFGNYFYAKSNGADLTVTGSGDMGCFPLVTYWLVKTPPAKDIVVGQADGTIKAYYNTGTDSDPTFDGGRFVCIDNAEQTAIDVGMRATPFLVDWNNDGYIDIVAGGLDGKIHIYINCNCPGDHPKFTGNPVGGILAQENGADLVVPQLCSSPVVADFDGDGKKDILTGNSAGQLLFYHNVGTDAVPSFSGYTIVKANGVQIDLDGTARSRPSLCNWNGDGLTDMLVGAADGKVHLYQGVSNSHDLNGDGNIDSFDLALLAARWRNLNCGYCSGADLNGDSNVNWKDLSILAADWLNGQRYKFYDFPLDSDPGWTTAGQWEFGRPLGQGGGDSYPDPNSGFTGENVYGVNLSGNMADVTGGPYYLIVGPLDCTGHYNVKLRFERWLNCDDPFYAQATIEAGNNGSDWQMVWQHASEMITDYKWQQMEYDISSVADNQPSVYIRWGYQTRKGLGAYSGWNIDDVQLWDWP